MTRTQTSAHTLGADDPAPIDPAKRFVASNGYVIDMLDGWAVHGIDSMTNCRRIAAEMNLPRSDNAVNKRDRKVLFPNV